MLCKVVSASHLALYMGFKDIWDPKYSKYYALNSLKINISLIDRATFFPSLSDE